MSARIHRSYPVSSAISEASPADNFAVVRMRSREVRSDEIATVRDAGREFSVRALDEDRRLA